MAFTPAQVIAEARPVINDTDPVSPRQADDELLIYVIQGINEIAAHKPQYFSTIGTVACVVGKCQQALSFANAIALIEVIGVKNGAAVTVFDRKAMDQFRPNWRNDTEGEAEQWAPIEGDPLGFFIYPKAPTGQELDVRFAAVPGDIALGASITVLPATFKPALVDYVIYRAESKDDPHVLSARAQGHYTAFLNKIGVQTNAAN